MYPRCFSPGKFDRRSSNGLHLKSTDLNLRSVPVVDGGVQISNARPGPPTKEEAPPLKDAPLRPSRAVRISSDDSISRFTSPLESLSAADMMEVEDSKSHINRPIRLFKDNSIQWVNDFEKEQAALVHNIRPSLFDEKADWFRHNRHVLEMEASQPQACTPPPLHKKALELQTVHRMFPFPNKSADWVNVTEEQTEGPGPMSPSLFAGKENSGRNLLGLVTPQPQAASTKSSAKISSSSTAKKPSKKKTKKRIIDEVEFEPTDDDVLFGRGGFANKHPGNIRFREKALELRRVYERSSKDEKYHISQKLVKSVIDEGGRFLEKGKDEKWHPVIGNGMRNKASQALREKLGIRNSVKKFTLITSGRHTSSVKKASKRITAIVKKNADIVFGEGSSLEKDMLQLRTTTTAEEMEKEKEISCALAESEREHLNSLSPRERENHIEQEWMINGAHLSSRVRGMTPEEAAIANSVREFAATEANRKQMASLGLASLMPEERVRQFKDYHYMLEVRKQFKRSEEAEDTL